MNPLNAGKPIWRVGVDRRVINPPPSVKLAGLGYYLNRAWQRIHDNFSTTALVITDAQENSVALIALDVMYNAAAFTAPIRQHVAARTGLQPAANIFMTCAARLP